MGTRRNLPAHRRRFFRSASFVLQPGVALYGGFAGNEASLDARDWQANQTILSGDVGEPGVQGDNSYHVVYGSNINLDTVLDGFIVRDGYANGGGHETHGGTIYLLNGNPTLTRLLVTGNFAQGNGGAMYMAATAIGRITFLRLTQPLYVEAWLFSGGQKQAVAPDLSHAARQPGPL